MISLRRKRRRKKTRRRRRRKRKRAKVHPVKMNGRKAEIIFPERRLRRRRKPKETTGWKWAKSQHIVG